ncbi:MAG: hypothetical protein ABI171_10310 [Collimonas sp.]|uniref:hypothetical protein n=1 Tax=Collimonas sp. TaxID=1963772 RepID=UPI00326681A9
MTSKDIDQIDDAEFDAFLQGDGDLARQLQGLPQPAPSAELDAAIMAQAETLMRTPAALPQAANDAALPHKERRGKPRFMLRWPTQLAMAASMVLAVLVTLRWQAEPTPEQQDLAQQQRQAEPAAPLAAAPALSSSPAALSTGAPTPDAASATTATAVATAPPAPPSIAESRQQTAPALSRSKRAKQDAPIAVKPEPAAKASAPVTEPERQIPLADAPSRPNYAAPQLPEVPSAILGARVRAVIQPRAAAQTSAAPAAPVASAPAPSPAPPFLMPVPAPVVAAPVLPAPAVASAAKPESTTKAETWLSAIDEMLKAGLRQDALEEWEKFNRAYPDYPVPKNLRDQIKALQR